MSWKRCSEVLRKRCELCHIPGNCSTNPGNAFLGFRCPMLGMHTPLTSLAACSSHAFPGMKLIPGNRAQNPGNVCTTHHLGCMQLPLIPGIHHSFLGIVVKSREHMSLGCMLVPLVPGIHTQSRESMHRVTSLVACWLHSFPGLLHNSWEFLSHSWESMHHTAHGTLTRFRYPVPGGHIPGNLSHNAGNSFPGIRGHMSLSWESLRNTVNSTISSRYSFPANSRIPGNLVQIPGNMVPKR